jgi:hypothetical protein
VANTRQSLPPGRPALGRELTAAGDHACARNAPYDSRDTPRPTCLVAAGNSGVMHAPPNRHAGDPAGIHVLVPSCRHPRGRGRGSRHGRRAAGADSPPTIAGNRRLSLVVTSGAARSGAQASTRGFD